MDQIGDVQVRFIAGFGPIVREPAASRKLYNQTLGIGFKEEDGGYPSHGGTQRREQLCPVASFAGGAILLWQRFVARRDRSAAILA